jgi:hypothetical protein
VREKGRESQGESPHDRLMMDSSVPSTLRDLAARVRQALTDEATDGSSSASGGVAALDGTLLPSLLSLLRAPDDVHDLAPLPLPHPRGPSAPSAPLSSAAAAAASPPLRTAATLPPLLHALSCTGSRPPLAHESRAPDIGSPFRSEAAYRHAAAGAVPEAAGAAMVGSWEMGLRLEDGMMMTTTRGPTTTTPQTHLAARVYAWAVQAPIALELVASVLRARTARASAASGRSSTPSLAASPLAAEILAAVVPFASYAPWTHPAAHAAADGVLEALAEACRLGAAGSAPALLARRFAPDLLEYCRTESVGGAWRERGRAHVRHLTVWTIGNIQSPGMAGDVLGTSLPLALRLADDWDPANAWLGASSLAHILEQATPTDLRAHAPLVREVLLRVGVGSGSAWGGRSPTLAHLSSYLQALAGPTLLGPAPALDLAAVTRGVRTGAAGGPVLDGPYDAALLATLRAIGTAPSSHTQFGLVDHLPALLLQMGVGGSGGGGEGDKGGCLVRHVTALLGTLTRLVAETADARVCCAGLHALRACVLAAPARFTVGGGEAEGVDASSRALAVDTALGAAVQAVIQAAARDEHGDGVGNRRTDGLGFYALPRVKAEDGTVSFLTGEDGEGAAASAAAAAEELITAFARALGSELVRLSPSHIAALRQPLSAEGGAGAKEALRRVVGGE